VVGFQLDYEADQKMAYDHFFRRPDHDPVPIVAAVPQGAAALPLSYPRPAEHRKGPCRASSSRSTG
jgi:hypothetical protein